ncbi:MAG TPA: hypothetical protein VIJ06_00045, partial [Methylovirgula sp.]
MKGNCFVITIRREREDFLTRSGYARVSGIHTRTPAEKIVGDGESQDAADRARKANEKIENLRVAARHEILQQFEYAGTETKKNS